MIDNPHISLADEVEEYLLWCMEQQLKEIDSDG